jgi:glutathione S-transferase
LTGQSCICREQWERDYKRRAPTGQCPYLELDDGSFLSQSTAIYMYVADLGGLAPADPLARAREMQIAGCIEDVRLLQTCA